MPLTRLKLNSRAKKIRLLAMDVDGVLTGGEIVVLDSGQEIKFWNAKDRLVMALIRNKKVPLEFAWITGRGSKNVTWAADDLGVRYLAQKCHDKQKALAQFMRMSKVTPDQVAFIGDDLIDLPALTHVGLAACPSDAVSDVKKHSHYVSPVPGGRGVVRDVIELILKAQKKWDPLVKPFLS